MSERAERARRALGAAVPLVALLGFLTWFGTAQATNRYWITLGIQAMWVGVSVIGLNLLLGYTGLLSLGHFAFFLYGGFVGAIWAVEDLGVNPWLGFPIAFLVGMAIGALLALTCCHLKGFYLTVVTLAFALIASSLALLFESLFNGLAGRAVTQPLDTNFSFLSADNPNRPFVGLYWVGVVLLLVCLLVTWNLMRSRWGRAFKAIRESEIAADASGVPTYRYKVASFALSAGMVSVGGVLAAQTKLQVTMASGTAIVGQSFQLVIDAVIGGLGTLAGPVVGAFAFTLGLGVNIGSKSVSDRLGEWETAALAALVVLAMIAMPDGIVGRLRRLGARRRVRGRRAPTPTTTPPSGDARPAGAQRSGRGSRAPARRRDAIVRRDRRRPPCGSPGGAGHRARAHRTERVGQDDRREPRDRLLPARSGPGAARAHEHHRLASPPEQRSGACPDVPELSDLATDDPARERDGGCPRANARRSPALRPGSRLAPSVGAPPPRSRPRAAVVRRACRSRARAGGRAPVRGATRPRDRAGAGLRSRACSSSTNQPRACTPARSATSSS